jgi:hypothetical protein
MRCEGDLTPIHRKKSPNRKGVVGVSRRLRYCLPTESADDQRES